MWGSTWTWPRERAFGLIRLFLLVALAYVAGSQFAMLIIERSGLQSVFFIPAGLTLAFLLRLDKRYWWIVLLAAGLTEAGMDLVSGYNWEQAAGFAAANMAEPLAGALIITTRVKRIDLARIRDVWWFVFGGVLAGPAIGAALGAATDRIFGGDSLLTTFGQWWLGDALGVVLIASAILVWGSSPDRRPLNSALGVGLLIGTGLLAFGVAISSLPMMFLVLIAIVACGLVIGARGVAMAALIVAVVVAGDIAIGVDPLLIGFTPRNALMVINLELALFGIAGLVVSAEAYERDLATSTAILATARAQVAESERRIERQIALRLQEALLPGEPAAHPKVSVAARYEAGSDSLLVGGDWYDVIDLPDGRIGISVGDVVGHGLEATASMGRLRTAMAALASHADSPGELLTALDRFAQDANGTRFATTAYAVLEPETGRLDYASAGHPPMLVVEADGRTRWLMGGRSSPLLDEAMDYRPDATDYLHPGSLLISYTDGLVERRGETLDEGLARLERAATAMREMGEDQICEGLMKEMGADWARDDVAVVVLRYEPSLVPAGPGG
jgi:serine phosphatase RsbU (regulator of sigma subunit)